jgi:hypothetical protein
VSIGPVFEEEDVPALEEETIASLDEGVSLDEGCLAEDDSATSAEDEGFTLEEDSAASLESGSVSEDRTVSERFSAPVCCSGAVEDVSSPHARSISDRAALQASIFFMIASFF